MSLEWKKRCKNDITDVSDRKIWETKCNKYRVVLSRIRYGRGPNGYPDIYYAMYLDVNCWSIISRHRKKNPAMKACEKHSK